MDDDLPCFNGINGVTGDYRPPLSAREIAALALKEPADDPSFADLKRRAFEGQDHLGVPNRDTGNLAEARPALALI